MLKGILSFYISQSHPDYKTIQYQAFEARRLYNTLNKLKEEKSELYKNSATQTPVANSLKIDLSKPYAEAWRKTVEQAQDINLPQKIAQHVAKQCDEAWSSIIKKRSNGESAGNPKYKGTYSNVRFTKQAFSHGKKATGDRKIVPSGWKHGVLLPKCVELNQIQSLNIVPVANGFMLKALYNKNAIQQPVQNEDANTIYAGGDLGLNKLITIITTEGSRPKTVNGKGLKSINRYFNKKIGRLKSKRDKSTDFGKGGERERLNKLIKRLWFKREKQVDHFLNVASNEIVRYLQKIGVQCFVIGWSNGFKNEINLGRRNNQNFVSIPHAEFRDLLVRKCEEVGIRVEIQEESYTSKASCIDGDLMPVYDKNNKIKYHFSGRRIKRGEYVSRAGVRIHADVNGAWNILRKCKPSIGWCSGFVVYPENLKLTL